MNKERWRQVNEIFHTALEQDTATREAYVQTATAGDPDLQREVNELLATHEKSPDILDRPAWEVDPQLALGDEGSLVGKQIGKYHVIEVVGRGGMGIVYAATDNLSRTVALKALPAEYTRDPVRRKRLIREALAAAAVSHPAIATVFSLEETDDEVYIISELVHGRTLREHLRDGPMPSRELLPVLISIAEALAAAHERGIVHRDLKPENVIRRDDGQIKVLDFGLARPIEPGQMSQLTQGFVIGTPGYMAPEQMTPGAEIDVRTDIFAFGVLAWELATGELPTAGFSRELPLPGLSRVVRKCMHRTPADRYPSARALLGALKRLGRDGHDTFWWWQGHQIIVSALNAAAPAAVWAVRPWVGKPGGSMLFILSLALAAISVAVRLNLFFASRVYPDTLMEHRARVFPAIAILDTLLAGSVLAVGVIIALHDHDGIAAIFVAFAAVLLVLLSLIEPATTEAAGLSRPRTKETDLGRASRGTSPLR